MAGLYTVQKNLQKPDYMDGMIRLTKYKTPLLTLLKRGKKPVNWAFFIWAPCSGIFFAANLPANSFNPPSSAKIHTWSA